MTGPGNGVNGNGNGNGNGDAGPDEAYDDVLGHVAARRRKRRQIERRRGRRSMLATGVVVAIAVVLTSLAAGAVGTTLVVNDELEGVALDNLEATRLGINSVIYDRSGKRLAVIPSTENRTPVPGSRISHWLKEATVAIEDRRFYEHDGVDYKGIVRAALDNIEAGEIVQGASTLEQQLVRNLYLTDERSAQTVSRKMREAYLAMQMSDEWSKERILDTYLNVMPYGGVTYGCEAGALHFFNVHCADLGVKQAALLAGLPQEPTVYDPFVNPKAAKTRRNQVLDAMLEEGYIGLRRHRKAVRSGLGLERGTYLDEIRQPYFVSYVRQLLQQSDRFGANEVRRGGLRVTTTIDQSMQRAARAAIRSTLVDPGAPAAALVAIDPRTGEILALDASTTFGQTKFNLPVQAKRQPGSTFKTFGLAAAIEMGIDPASMLYMSEPLERYPLTENPITDNDFWDVNTAEGFACNCPVTLAKATVLSDNTVFARLSIDIGVDRTIRMAHRLGIQSELPEAYSVILGSGAVSPLELTSAYATIAAQGIYREPLAVTRVNGFSGRTLEETPANANKGRRVVADGVAYEVTQLLEQNVDFGTGTGAQLFDGRPQAGKTGTTEKHADAWFCGYTPNLAACVWMGYSKGEIPMENVQGTGPAFGGGYPATIWQKFMTQVLGAQPNKFPAVDWPFPQNPPVFQPFDSKFEIEYPEPEPPPPAEEEPPADEDQPADEQPADEGDQPPADDGGNGGGDGGGGDTGGGDGGNGGGGGDGNGGGGGGGGN